MTDLELLCWIPWGVVKVLSGIGLFAFAWLPLGTILAAVKALGGIGLFVFAGTQVWLQRQDRRDRKRTALAVVFADKQRLQARSLQWEGEDLVAAAHAGMLFHEGLAPPDWGVVMRSLGELGPEVAALGSYGLRAPQPGGTVGADSS